MTAPLTRFEVGQLYSNDDISCSLGVGNAGGIRPHLTAGALVRRLVLMTASPKRVSPLKIHTTIVSKAMCSSTPVPGSKATKSRPA